MTTLPPFPFDLTSPEGRQVWLQWLQAKAKANLAVELAKLEAAGLLKDGVWTLPEETPKDMREDVGAG